MKVMKILKIITKKTCFLQVFFRLEGLNFVTISYTNYYGATLNSGKMRKSCSFITFFTDSSIDSPISIRIDFSL